MRPKLTLVDTFFTTMLDNEIEDFVYGDGTFVKQKIKELGYIAETADKLLQDIHEGEYKELLNGDKLDRV